ncbi:unnamed protein product [Schistosoma bovis]|nr:unnamed protein product [Schistosoma bovis]
MVYIHRISIYRSNYFMKFIQSQVREINAFLSRHLRVYSLFSCVIWLLLIGAFLRTTWNLSHIIWNQSSYDNNANLNNYDKRWKPTIHTVSRLTDAMLNLWPVYIAKGILPPSDITLISFSSQSPFPFDSQLNSVTEFDKREQHRVLLTNIFHGLITRLIWIYPSWKQSSFNQFYKKSQFHVGLAQINLLEDDDYNNNNTNSNNDLKSNFPSRITTFCLCNPAGNFCSLPLLSSYTVLLKDVYNKLSYLSLIEQDHLINDINQFINSMLHFITTHDSNLLSYWSNQSLISSTSCCYLKPSIELISLNSNENIYVFNQWKNRYQIAFYYLDNYCSYSDAMINVLLNKPTIMVGAKKELSSLWSWLCTLNTVTLKFISQFVVCTYQSENHMQSIGLCNREKSSSISFDEIPVIQRSSLTLYTLESVITCLPRPLSVNLVMHPSWEKLIHKMHLSTELCKILNESVLNKQDNLSRKGDKG